ncbi:hypothetical protein [uncultured Formosa sp.]|uniref:hypothetical protein n=1 Tax=uncultured Formosa sp. TaxID=255435 RepID=UPI00260E5D11|nr:hypothetical protein [uncultured Formosa sp.]
MKEIMIVLMAFGAMGSVYACTEKSLMLLDTISISNSNIEYLVTDNQTNITLNISTQDPKTIMSILHHGLTVYFDLKGKENKKVSITYPKEPLKISKKPVEERTNNFQTDAEVMQMRQTIKALVTVDFSEEAVFVLYNDTDIFNVLLNSLGITAVYTYNEADGVLNYQLTLPKHKIKEKSKQDFSKLKIGVVTTKKDKSNRENRSEDFGNEQRELGGSGGRPPGGGGRGGQSKNQQLPEDGKRNEPIEIDFWFDAHL